MIELLNKSYTLHRGETFSFEVGGGERWEFENLAERSIHFTAVVTDGIGFYIRFPNGDCLPMKDTAARALRGAPRAIVEAVLNSQDPTDVQIQAAIEALLDFLDQR